MRRKQSNEMFVLMSFDIRTRNLFEVTETSKEPWLWVSRLTRWNICMFAISLVWTRGHPASDSATVTFQPCVNGLAPSPLHPGSGSGSNKFSAIYLGDWDQWFSRWSVQGCSRIILSQTSFLFWYKLLLESCKVLIKTVFLESGPIRTKTWQ